jgi:hypothetical protein
MTDERTIEQMAADAVAKFLAEWNAPPKPTEPTPDQEISARLRQAMFREQIGEAAINAGVRPRAVKHVIRDAADQFALREGQLVPKHGQTDPADPLAPLTPASWLRQLASTDPYLFVTEK